MVRPGNVHSAERWREALGSGVNDTRRRESDLLFRADASFAKPEVHEYLESRDIGYAMRLSANEVLQRYIRHLLKRPLGRPPKRPVARYHDFVRRLTLPESVKHWSLRSVQTKVIKMGGRLVRHARRLVFQLAEVAVSREVFRQVLERIGGLHPAPG